MGDVIEYSDVLQEVRGCMHPGRLKLQANSIIFKNNKNGKVDQFPATDVEKANWLIRARGYCLKVIQKSGTVHRFDGIKDTEYERLGNFIKEHYGTKLVKKDISHKGWNWGIAKFKGNSLDFEVDGSLAFEVPLNNVSHSVTNKNEVTLEFHQNDDAAVSLTELRFHIPSEANAEKDPVEEFYDNILSQADIIQATGDAITNFSQVYCVTPRGRYDIKMYPSFLQLHGKTFDYKVPYASILRLFLLPHKDNRQTYFVVSLDPPIKQGQTRYHFLILLFGKEDEITLELSLSEEDIQAKYEGRLSKEMSGPEYEIISRVMKSLVNRKITVPGVFSSNKGAQCVSCSYKAGTGLLFPLERGFIFVHKPAVHIRFDEVANVNFARSTASLRSFDFDVETKNGTVYTFVGIEKDEYGKLYDFVSQKKLRVKNIGGKSDKGTYNEDMAGSDDDEVLDPYMERMKAEGKQREEIEDEDDDSSDESFKAPDDSGSDVAEEYDSNVETTDSEDEGSGVSGGEGGESKPKKKKKEPKPKKTKTVSERKPRRKKAKKDVDPDRPKRPQTAYFLWLNENRAQLKEKHPGLHITELSKKAGEAWRQLTDTDKSKHEAEFQRLKKEYEKAMVEYNQNVKDRPKSSSESPPKKKQSKAANSSPQKDTKAGSGLNYKSKEFISSSESSGDEGAPAKKKKKEPKKEKAESPASSEDEKPLKKKSKKDDDEVDELPSDEEILSSPSVSGSEEGSGSESGSGEEKDEGSD